MNCCNFTGRLTRDPEMRQTNGGLAVGKFTLAVDMRKNKNGEKVTEFIDMTAFGKTAETLGKWCKKGKEIAVTGEFRTDKWEDKESGQKRSKSYIVVNNFNFLGGSGRGEAAVGAATEEPAPDAAPAYDDDIPF